MPTLEEQIRELENQVVQQQAAMGQQPIFFNLNPAQELQGLANAANQAQAQQVFQDAAVLWDRGMEFNLAPTLGNTVVYQQPWTFTTTRRKKRKLYPYKFKEKDIIKLSRDTLGYGYDAQYEVIRPYNNDPHEKSPVYQVKCIKWSVSKNKPGNEAYYIDECDMMKLLKYNLPSWF